MARNSAYALNMGKAFVRYDTKGYGLSLKKPNVATAVKE